MAFGIIGVRQRCSVHLINGGITWEDNVVVIEFGLSAPSDVVKEDVTIECSQDAGAFTECKIMVAGLKLCRYV